MSQKQHGNAPGTAKAGQGTTHALPHGAGTTVPGLAGAYYGLDAIPVRWTQPLHVPLPGFGGRVPRLPDLFDLACRLACR
ncbi:hypothetical protein Saso_23420 [Streptomyces asoensis]|uniref:Uncharacterized protein n=1 Tax=Streptomyces asoensis TaxID=249586 RepID=A0ABQ3RY74_9ACTN|nr:hypothetical protein GCM10010496_16010 [Streptomyces asoensis]GHI60692.1 hypothetical protein Saso_23420 [Streptomyces asoensis]